MNRGEPGSRGASTTVNDGYLAIPGQQSGQRRQYQEADDGDDDHHDDDTGVAEALAAHHECRGNGAPSRGPVSCSSATSSNGTSIDDLPIFGRELNVCMAHG